MSAFPESQVCFLLRFLNSLSSVELDVCLRSAWSGTPVLLYTIFSLADSLGRSHMLSDPYSDLGKELAARSPKAHKSLIFTSACLSWGHVELTHLAA